MGVVPNAAIRIDAASLAPGLKAGIGVTQAQIDDAVIDFAGRTPLWYYILREAELTAAGQDAAGQPVGSSHLGAVGGRLVAEVLIGLLAGDPLSSLSVQPHWTPSLPRRDRTAVGPFTFADLVAFATGLTD